MASLWAGNLTKANEAANAYLRWKPQDPYGHVNLATIYDFQNRKADASAVVEQLTDRFPKFGITNVIRTEPYKEREKLDRVIEVLRRGGLPG